MKNVFFFIYIIFLIFLLIFFLYFFIFGVVYENLEKSSSFECGFSSFSGLGITFSMPFFVISVIFLLFDVEILVLCFYPFFVVASSNIIIFLYFICLVVLFSTLFEWLNGILDWF